MRASQFKRMTWGAAITQDRSQPVQTPLGHIVAAARLDVDQPKVPLMPKPIVSSVIVGLVPAYTPGCGGGFVTEYQRLAGCTSRIVVRERHKIVIAAPTGPWGRHG